MKEIKILDLKETNEEVEMYDLDVEDNHNFILRNGIITHNSGKSNLLYFILDELRKKNKFNLYVYGLRNKLKEAKEIYSVSELEQIKNSVVILDEIMSLWDLNNRTAKRQIEKTLRLINHNNNILLICGVPDNFRKFIAGKLDMIIIKKVTFNDFVNGSRIKNIVLDYNGNERGTSILNLNVDEAIIFDGLSYYKINVPYFRKYDTKKNNEPILKPKKCSSKRVA